MEQEVHCVDSSQRRVSDSLDLGRDHGGETGGVNEEEGPTREDAT